MSRLLHIHNAKIWTADRERPWARSLTAADGRIIALDADGPAARSSGSIDAGGRTVAPGLIDSHMHLLMGGQALGQLDLSGVKSRAEFEAAIGRRHAELPPDRWLIARGWSQENWPGEGGGMPDRSWLAAAEDRPVVCHRMDMHAAVVNEPVLRLCDTARDPPGGEIARGGDGRPTGLMLEAAAWRLVNPLIPKSSAVEQQAQLLQAQAHAHQHGLTAVGSMEYARDVADVFEPIREQLTLRCAITLLDRDWPLDVARGLEFAPDDQLRIIGFKAFIDGTLGSRTARMLAEYADAPGQRGMLVELAQRGLLQEWARLVAGHGLSPSMHAIGDEAVRLALDAVDALAPEVAKRVRPRIEHSQHVHADDVARFGGLIASMQPLHKADDCRYVCARLGEGRAAGAFAFRSLLEAGATLAFGSDWPVVSCDPMLGVRAAVTGLTLDGGQFGIEQNLTVEESLRAYTADAAFALGLDDAGVLRPGARADMVMFDRDPFSAEWAAAPPRVQMTLAAGRVVYDGRVEHVVTACRAEHRLRHVGAISRQRHQA